MIKYKRIELIAVLLMALAVSLTGFVYMNPSAVEAVIGTFEAAYISEMNKMEIMDIQIIADEIQWMDMLENAAAEEYIPATVIINGKKIDNVGIRPKGNSSLLTVAQDSTTDRYSFKIEFDRYITGQTWHGLDKLAVNNMMGDASYMKEYMSYDIMSYIGVEAPLRAFADISVNGEAWGFYLAVECLEESYAQRVYGSNHGKLYKPESMGMRGDGRMNEFIEEMRNNEGNNAETEGGQFWRTPQDEGMQRQAPQGGEMQRQTPQDGEVQRQMPQDGEMQRQMPQDGEVQQQMTQNGEMQRQIPPQNSNTPNIRGGENRRGGMGAMGSNGVSLQYVDNEISSYSDIFGNSVFEGTKADYDRVIGALLKLSSGEDIENAVDVEATLRYFAAHTVVVNLDSYVSNMAHNYYLYEYNGRLTILPWDYNLAFGGFQSRSASSVVNFPIDTPVSGVSLEDRPLLGKLLEVPEHLEMYHSYLEQIVSGYFDSGIFERTVDYLDALIAAYVENDSTSFYDYEAYKNAVIELKKLGALRAESVKGQLNGSIPSTTEGQNAYLGSLVDASSINLSLLGSQGGGMGGADGRRWNNSEVPINRSPDVAAGRQAGSSVYGMDAWLLSGVCLLILSAGLLFVVKFKRRNV